MTQGPIEFLGDSGPAHEVEPTEFTGADGLIQPVKPEILSGDPAASGGHTLEGDHREEISEINGIMGRRAMQPLDVVRGVVLDGDDGADPTDPVTGRVAPPTMNKAGGAKGELTDLAPY